MNLLSTSLALMRVTVNDFDTDEFSVVSFTFIDKCL